MRVSRSTYIVGNVGMILLGVIPAVLLAVMVKYLWEEMALPTFFISMSSWVAFGVARILGHDGRRDVALTTISAESLKIRESVGRPSYTATVVGGTLLGAALALLIAGGIGLLWPGGRWPVFFVILTGWIGMSALYVRKSFDIDKED